MIKRLKNISFMIMPDKGIFDNVLCYFQWKKKYINNNF